MAASDLGQKALRVAALNDLCHLCPPWTQAGCALNAVSREVSKLAADVRRRRRRKLLALRNEIRRHTFVTLRNCTQVPSRWFKIHGVREETVILESIEMRYDKSRFCVVMLPLDEWEAKFEEWNDSLSENDTDCMECWYRGFSQYARDESDDDDDGLGH